MTYKVVNIKYDTTDSQGTLSADEGISLPKSLTIMCDSEEEIADTISDWIGWLVESYEIAETIND